MSNGDSGPQDRVSEESETTGDPLLDMSQDDYDEGVYDFAGLPDYGNSYFSLTDASMLAALDEWWEKFGKGPEPDFSALITNRAAREAAKPLQQKILRALIRSIGLKELDVKTFARDLSTSDLIPERTYAHLADIQGCLTRYGLGDGILLSNADALDQNDFYGSALAVFRRRLAIRFGVSQALEELPKGDPLSVIEHLRGELKARELQIARQNLSGVGRSMESAKPFSPRERNNLHRTVGALLALVLPQFNGKQEALIAEIESRYRGAEGLSKRQLEKVLPLAKSTLAAER